jgi:hypothetical protein
MRVPSLSFRIKRAVSLLRTEQEPGRDYYMEVEERPEDYQREYSFSVISGVSTDDDGFVFGYVSVRRRVQALRICEC